MALFKEFKEFAVKGNALELAVGIIIGIAFGKIVSSLVSDIIMPPLSALVGGMNFTDLKWVIKQPSVDGTGKLINAITLNYGSFIQAIFDFVIIAFCVFMFVKSINSMKRKEEDKKAKAVEPSAEVRLLSEIRDLLKK
jgi:large conductance mechanosensitive channel